ncbi:MAG: inositol monophosphatase [Spirochaetia bacterium]|nr:inositol monophosphatase [Spirochaetia bacterium]
MGDAGIIEFPLDDVEHRVNTVLGFLPDLGKSLLSIQPDMTIRRSVSAATDRALMQKADRHIEKAILSGLSSIYVQDGIVSEEDGRSGGDGDFQWWIDPVDGTRNFIHNQPLFCISIGLCFRGHPVAGVVYAPALSETYTAVYGSGAFKNGNEIFVSPVSSIERSLVATGLPYHRKEILSDLMADISAFVSSGSGLRRTGSAIIDMCWIAEGRLEAMWERGVKPWDLCAASVIVREAGGKITGFGGEAFDMHTPDVVVSNQVSHDSIVDILRQARAIEGMN